MNAREAFNEMMHRQAKARVVRQEAEIRAQLVTRIRSAIQDADEYSGDGDLFTHMAEASVKAFEDYTVERQNAMKGRHHD